MSPAANMEIVLRSVVFVCCLLTVRGAGAVKNLTFCTNARIPTTTPCTQEDTVIQVMDVYVYDFPRWGYFEGARDCLYQHGDYGEPLIDVSSRIFDKIVTRCDGRQACHSLWVLETELSDGSDSNYIVMYYTCVRNAPTVTIDSEVDGTFGRTSCVDNAVLHVISVYAEFSESCRCCPDNLLVHVDGDFFRRAEYECEQNKCVNLTAPPYEWWCGTQRVTLGLKIKYRCNAPETTMPVVTTSVLTPLSVTSIETDMTSLTTPTSPLDRPGIATDHSAFTVTMASSTVSGGVGIEGPCDPGSDDQTGGSGASNQIGVIVGVCVATLTVIILAVLVFICVRRKKNSRPGPTIPVHTNQAYSGQVVDSPARSSPAVVENIYNDGDEDCSVVGSALGGPAFGDHALDDQALRPRTLGTQDLRGQPARDAGQHDDAVYYNVPASDDQHSADYSLATGINEYSAVNKQHSETREPPEVNDTELVDNAQYAPWQGTVNAGDDNDMNTEDTMVDNPEYDQWTK